MEDQEPPYVKAMMTVMQLMREEFKDLKNEVVNLRGTPSFREPSTDTGGTSSGSETPSTSQAYLLLQRTEDVFWKCTVNETYVDQMEKRSVFLEAAKIHFPLLGSFSEALLEGKTLSEEEGAKYTKMLSEFNTRHKGQASNLMKKLSLPCFNPRDPYRSGKDEETYGRRLYALAESTFRHALHNKLDFMYWDRDPRTGQKLKITNPIRLVVGDFMAVLKTVHKNKHDYEITYFKKCRSDDQNNGAFVADAPIQKRRRRSTIVTTSKKNKKGSKGTKKGLKNRTTVHDQTSVSDDEVDLSDGGSGGSDSSDSDDSDDEGGDGNSDDGSDSNPDTPVVRATVAQKQPKSKSERIADSHEEVAFARGQALLNAARASASNPNKHPRYPAHMPSYALAHQHKQQQATAVNTSNSLTAPVNPLFQKRISHPSPVNESGPSNTRVSAKKKSVVV